ncbi:PREDICTED: endogenous retrovirus group K member 7 Env polyprotein-like, partial [Chinchilla lanigera]|uniref:endogenous retrovirus group K member 7 Env polyprotein-like n=1 Tax=Chinchilla lanigera TaxID=34839 RepID=UPI000696D4FF
MRPLGVCFSALASVFDPDRPYEPDLHVAIPQYHKPDSLRSCPSGLKSKQGIYAQLTDTLFVWGTWHECGFDIGHTITNTEYNPIVHDWSRYWKESEETVINYFSASYPGGLQAPSYSLTGTPLVQSQLWKLIAAARPLRVMKRYQGCLINSREIAVEACVHSPFSLLVDLFPFNLTIRPFEGGYKLSCSTCFLTNCLNSSLSMPLRVFVLHKPPFVIIPVSLPDPWEASTPIGLLSVLRDTLTRSKRFVGLVIAGIAAVITLLASASLSVVSLMETQRSGSYVNEFAINMTSTLLLQEQVNHQLITRLDSLEEAVMYLGDQVLRLKHQLSLSCHPGYPAICVTPAAYNESEISWKSIQLHLMGLWNDSQLTFDVSALHKKIISIAQARASFSNTSWQVNDINTILRDWVSASP